MKSIRELQELIGLLNRFFSPSHKKLLLHVSAWAALLSVLEMLLATMVIPYIQCLGGNCDQSLVGLSIELPPVPAMSAGLLFLITVKLVIQGRLTWSSVSLNQRVQRDAVSQLLDGYLHIDWGSFRSRHTTHYFRRCAVTAVDAAYVSQQCVTMISSGLMLVSLVVLMLWKYPLVSVVLGISFITLNLITQSLIGKQQNRVAYAREQSLQRWSIGMTEAFASFREIRVFGVEGFFLNHLDQSIRDLEWSNRRLGFLPTLPRMILDFAMFGILLTTVSFWMMLDRSIAELLPQLVFYAVIARAILPAMINLLSTRAVLFGSIVNIRLVLEEFAWIASKHRAKVGVLPWPEDRCRFALEEVTFRYEDGLDPVLSNASLEIDHPSWIGVRGVSGAGKSTLVELLCGIHLPESGRVIHGWKAHGVPAVAYLPQHVALVEGSVWDNVVFGFDAGDATRVMDALWVACLDEWVNGNAHGYDAEVGVDGSKLSGGQRQRLALARALYRKPDLLLLDEVTSGLDEATEFRLLARLRDKKPEMSVVLITHRSSGLHFVDRVVEVADGQILEAQSGISHVC